MKNRKKFITVIGLIMALALALGLTACGGGDNKDNEKDKKIDIAGTAYTASYEDGDISVTIPKGWTIKDENEWAERGYLCVGEDANRRDDGYNQVEVTYHVNFSDYDQEGFDDYIAQKEKDGGAFDEDFKGCKEYKFNDSTYVGYEDTWTTGDPDDYDMRYMMLGDNNKIYEIRVYIKNKDEMMTDAVEKGIKILLASFKPSM